jgi:predicted nucleic acid-binding protein
MPVVFNTSPINYLVLIEAIEILSAIHQWVLIPIAVSEELRHPGSPDLVRRWIGNPPDWLEVRQPKPSPDERLAELGRGERDALLLAEELGVPLVIDEIKAHREAQRRSVSVLRTLAVLDKGAERGLINLAQVVVRLRQTNFRVPPKILDQLLDQHAARKSRSGPA